MPVTINLTVFDVNNIVQSGGLLVVALIVFAESGILLGFILPGDSLLLTAGLFAGQGKLPIGWLVPIVIISAILGYQVGYMFGERAGPRLFKRKGGILLRADYIQKTEKFFAKYGALTVVGARFIAHVRTFVSVVAGASSMDKRKYFLCNVIGAVLWGGGLTMLGYWLGSTIPNIDRVILPLIVGVLIVFYVGVMWGVLKSPDRRRNIKKGLKEDWQYFVGHKVD
jgi:membrane-associated protein